MTQEPTENLNNSALLKNREFIFKFSYYETKRKQLQVQMYFRKKKTVNNNLWNQNFLKLNNVFVLKKYMVRYMVKESDGYGNSHMIQQERKKNYPDWDIYTYFLYIPLHDYT